MGDISNLDVSWRTLVLFGLWVPIFLIALQLCFRELEQVSSRYLALFMAIFALGITPQIIGFSGFYQVFPWLTFAPFNTDLWLGPLLLLHLRRLCLSKKSFANGLTDTMLLLPGILQSLYYSGCFLFLDDYKAKWAFNDAFHEPYIVPLETVAVISLTLFCLWQCYLLMNNYRKFLDDTQSQADSFVPVWFQGLFYALVLLSIAWLLLEVLSLVFSDFSYTNQYPFYVFMSLVMVWCGLQALSDIRMPYPRVYALEEPTSATQKPAKEQSKSNDWQEKAQALNNAMAENQWYLESDLNLSKLAVYLSTNQTYLSRTINEGFTLNFNQFVNQFRVKHAQHFLSTQPDLDLLDIAFDSEFNSKASFNRIFKSETSLTPGQYRSQHQLHE